MSCLSSFGTHTADKLYDTPPDGGYGWFIVGGHFVNIGIGYAFTKSFGVFFPYIRDEFDVDNTTTSLIFSIMMFTQYCGSLVGNILYRTYGPRVTLWLGGLLCGFGLVVVGVVQTLWSMYLGVGIMVGLGFSFVILVGSATVSRFFKAKRPQAIAFAMTGVPLMSIMFPIIYEFLYNHFSLFGAMIIMGGIQLNVIVGGTFFRPINLASDHNAAAAQKGLFKKLGAAFARLLKNPNFLLYSSSIAFVISGKFMVNPFIKDYAVKNIGLDKYQPAMILSICSGIDIFFRPLGGKLCSTKFVREKLGTFETFSIAVIGLASCNMFAPLWVNSFAAFAVYGVIFGMFFGLTIGVEWSNVAELVDSDILSDAITFIQLETSIGVLLSPLLGGYISDKTGDYSYVFYIAGLLLYAGAACAIAVAVRRRCSFGEITVDSPVEGSIVIEEKKDGFEMGDASLLPQNGSSQPIASKSLLGVNVAVNPNSRYRGKTGKNRELDAAITDSVASLHA